VRPTTCTFVNDFGPVYSLMASGANRVIGFSRINLRPDPSRPAALPCTAFLISRDPARVATANASANLMGGLPLPTGAPAAEVTELLAKNLVRGGALNYAPVFAPVLAR
jgi:hypothetical protein